MNNNTKPEAGGAAAPLYKIGDLFGNEQTVIITKSKVKNGLFEDYEAFLKKFEPKKTTDDCYTPQDVMDVVVNYVNEKFPLTGKKIVRPFYPGGDYEKIDYTEDMVVIDNPPFSIISKICRYYIEKGVKFFLFCPHLTAFSSDIDCTHIITSVGIVYENGAIVKTSFVSNLFGDMKIIGDSDLHRKIKEVQEKNKANLPRYEYPDNVITASKIAYCVENGVSLSIHKKDLKHCRGLDAQKKHGKALFGAGFLASDNAAATIVAATAAAAAVAAAKKNNVIVWDLSPREKEIIKSLNST